MKHLRNLVALTLLALPLTACSLSGDAIDGQVLEEGTNKPVAGAVVVVTWTGNDSSGLVHGQSVCYHVETATSDAMGKFHIGRWSDGVSMRSLFIGNRAIYKEAYKAGYTRPDVPSNKPEKVLVAPFKGTKDEYFYYLDRLAGSNGCPGGGESKKNLYRLYAPLAEEAKNIAENIGQKKLAEKFIGAANRVLVNYNKPTTTDHAGWTVNVNSDDNYKKEELLK